MNLHVFTSNGTPVACLKTTTKVSPADAARVVTFIKDKGGTTTGAGYLSRYPDLRGIPVRPDGTVKLELMPRMLRGTGLVAYIRGLTEEVWAVG